MSTGFAQVTPYSAIPLPWRSITPLHRKLGARALRYVYTGGTNLPQTSTPANLQLQFANTEAIDRIVAYSLSIGVALAGANFTIQEANTGWRQTYTYNAGRGLFLTNTLETLPDTCNLTWWFDAALGVDTVVTFYNVELVPFIFA